VTPEVVEVGKPCPRCGYEPLYDDAGTIRCVGCDAEWTSEEFAAYHGDEDEEEEE